MKTKYVFVCCRLVLCWGLCTEGASFKQIQFPLLLLSPSHITRPVSNYDKIAERVTHYCIFYYRYCVMLKIFSSSATEEDANSQQAS